MKKIKNILLIYRLIKKDLSKDSFNKGDKILTGMLYVNGQEYVPIDLCSGEDREYTPLFSVPGKTVDLRIPIACSAAATLAVLIAGLLIYFKKTKKKSKRKKRNFSDKDIETYTTVNDSINYGNNDDNEEK